ncbi:hypothetical protein NSA24_10100 [Clostridioides mangenotii]|uniref:hypothetical protein n=1 Tax=Metaclostridioides mangenotii TaxID=1540 RepID=UPI002149E195|nr:hypothetical protein [Clostridioides mangenotii]MCR1955143.1 hypothetical protein [Clostridioides mangenotii]
MIFLGNLEQIKDNKHKVNFIHYKAELLQDTSNGILVEKLPESTQQEGKVAVLYVNIDTKEPFYEFEDIPMLEESEIDILKKQVAELSFLVMQLQGGTN